MSFIHRILRIKRGPAVKLYHGFGSSRHFNVYGHVLFQSPKSRKTYRDNFFVNTLALIRLFFVKPGAHCRVVLEWEGRETEAVTEKDGFFHFAWEEDDHYPPGNHSFTVRLLNKNGSVSASADGSLKVPAKNQFTFISDIDDTFLISHSATILKRLYVLLTENAYTRKTFKGVITHYNFLRNVSAPPGNPNPFFYVSSSEWNLYDYIRDFIRANGLPDGVYLLNQIKTLKQLFKTGKNNHNGKFFRIVRIIESYPDQRFVLLGDDTQRDPYIYASVVQHFPDKIFAVFIRAVSGHQKPEVVEALAPVSEANVHVQYFTHSSQALTYSKELFIGA